MAIHNIFYIEIHKDTYKNKYETSCAFLVPKLNIKTIDTEFRSSCVYSVAVTIFKALSVDTNIQNELY